MTATTAPLVGIFSGIQGEGLFVGARHLFIRFARCNRACRYCDTPESREVPAACTIEEAPGARTFRHLTNPLTIEQVVEVAAALDTPPGLHDAVSLTGGEPLCHPDFLAALCPRLRDAGLSLYLETNGTLPDALAPLTGAFDHAAMDIKLESATGEPTDWAAHRRFLDLLPRGARHVKIVVAAQTTDAELNEAAELIGAARGVPPVVLQPVSPIGGAIPPGETRLLAMQALLRATLPDVRVIPQTHKHMGQK
jgi:organic radical activating enzyme